MCMTGTPPVTRPPVYSPFLRETLRRLSGERLVIFQASKFEQILIVDQYLHNLAQSQFGGLVTYLLLISIVFNNLVSVRFQKFDNTPPEKLFSVVDLFYFNFYSTSTQLFYSTSTQASAMSHLPIGKSSSGAELPFS